MTDLFCEIYKSEKWNREYAQYNLSTILKNKFSFGSIVFNGEEAIGFILSNIFYFGNQKYGKIEEIAIKETYQNLGIGTELVAQSLQFFYDNACYSVYLECQDEIQINNFYIKQGFEKKNSRNFFEILI
ncbi:GNAT family N-acetyltransferase [Enterococcus faecalis]|nr:GNAT family N-acetyltransferase [Enterococcus faecalis]